MPAWRGARTGLRNQRVEARCMRAGPLLDSGASLAALERDALAELRPEEAEVPDVHRALHLRVEEEHVVARARGAQPRGGLVGTASQRGSERGVALQEMMQHVEVNKMRLARTAKAAVLDKVALLGRLLKRCPQLLGYDVAARLDALRPTKFQPDSDKQMLACQAQVAKNGDFYGPWLAVP